MPYKYMLRFSAQPGFYDEEKLEELVSFCMEAGINDVMFFINQEELNQGHLTRKETEPWMELIARGKRMLDPQGITTSINPWPTLLHSDRGAALRPEQHFTLMVGSSGEQATAVACPLCPEWQRYIADIYACYASLNPYILWVEDDFRLHNHGARLGWGGCFCDMHMAEYSRKAGRMIERDEFIQAVLKPGDPHPWRKIWLDTGRETMVDLAKLIGEAVHKVAPSTRVGLMSSVPSTHCAEGRDWHGILGGLSGTGVPMVNRAHLPSYGDIAPSAYLWYFAAAPRLTRAAAPQDTEQYPELECFPYSRFSKSGKFTRFQIITSLLLQPGGITLNIHGMVGNGITPRDSYSETLKETHDFANRITDLGIHSANETGVRVLTSPDSSYSIHTREGKSLTELHPAETFWASLLSCFGVAYKYHLGTPPSESVVAVSGQYFRNLDENSIRKLLGQNFVILEGEAAFTLFDMGLGDIAGIRDATWHDIGSGFTSYEQVCDGRIYCGMPEARMTSQVGTGVFLEVEYTDAGKLEMKTAAKNSRGEMTAPGMVLYDRRVFLLPYGRFAGMCSGELNSIRQEILQGVLESIDDRYPVPLFVREEPYITVNSYDMGSQMALFLTNWSLDDISQIRIFAQGLSEQDAYELSLQSNITPKLYRDGSDIVLESGLAHMESKVLLLHKQQGVI